MKDLLVAFTNALFKIDLIVWKQLCEEGSVYRHDEFKIDLIVWKRGNPLISSSNCPRV